MSRRRRKMKHRFLGQMMLAATLMAGTGIAKAATPSDAEIGKKLRHELLMYPRYTIWDDVSFRVVDGQVELLGAVNQPFKKADMERLAKNLPGVTSIKNEIKVLPLSPFDDTLRLQVARAIYGDRV